MHETRDGRHEATDADIKLEKAGMKLEMVFNILQVEMTFDFTLVFQVTLL